MSPARDRARLLELLRELSFERRKVVLASGRESDFYIDCKRTALTAEGHALVGRCLLSRVRAICTRRDRAWAGSPWAPIRSPPPWR